MGLNIYKRGQGANTRLYSGLIAFAIVAIGCWVLYGKLQILGNVWLETLVPFGLCAGLGGLIFWIVNKPSIADFMISAEGEIKKVSWSSRKEIMISTLVVMIVVALMAIMLSLADWFFAFLFRVVFKIY